MKTIKILGIVSILFVLPFVLAGIPSGKKVKEVARAINQGKIDVGKDYGLGEDQRWHRIHSDPLGMDCEDCHIEKYDNNYLYQRRYKVPVRDAPGVVKREVCLNCHRAGGPAGVDLYGRK